MPMRKTHTSIPDLSMARDIPPKDAIAARETPQLPANALDFFIASIANPKMTRYIVRIVTGTI